MHRQRLIKRQDNDEGEWPSTDTSGDWPETSTSSEDWSSTTTWVNDQSTSSWSDVTSSESSWTPDTTTSSSDPPQTWVEESSSTTSQQSISTPLSTPSSVSRKTTSTSVPPASSATRQRPDAPSESSASSTTSSSAPSTSASESSSSSTFPTSPSSSSPSLSSSRSASAQQGLSNIAVNSASAALSSLTQSSSTALVPGVQPNSNVTPDGASGAEGNNHPTATHKSGIKTEAIVGIVIGCLAAGIAIFLLLRTINAHYRQARTRRLLSQISFGTFGSPRYGTATPFSAAGLGKQSLQPTDVEPVVEKRESRIEVLAPRPQLGRPRSATYSRESDTPFWLEQLGLARPPRDSRGGNPRLSVVAPSDTSSQLANNIAGRVQHYRLESDDSGNHLRPLRIRTRIPSPTLEGPATGGRSTITDPLSSHGSAFSPPWSVSAGDFPVPIRPGLNRISSEISAVPPYPGSPPVRNLQVPLQGLVTSPTRRFSANNPYRQSAGASSVHTNPYSLYSHSLIAPSEYGTAPFELEESAASPTIAQQAHTGNINSYYQHLAPTNALPSAAPKRHSSSSSLYSKEGHQVWPLSNSLPISGESSPNRRVSNEWTRPGSTMEETYRTYSQILDEYSGTGRAL